MNTLVDHIKVFRVTQDDINIPMHTFMGKMIELYPARCTQASTNELWCAPGDKSRSIRITPEEYKERMSKLIKDHVRNFHEIQWK